MLQQMLRKKINGGRLINFLGTRFYSSDQEELSREKLLRESVVKKYPGLNLPPISMTYGNFANSNSPSGPGIPVNELGSQQQRTRRLLLICLAGLMVVWTSKSISNQLSKNNLNIPLWAASLEDQAKHILFCVQYDEKTRNALATEFAILRKTNPFLDFFSWVSVKKPDFCCGHKYNNVYAISTVLNALQMENVAASRIVSKVLFSGGGDERKRVDDLVDALPQLMGIANLLSSLSTVSQTPTATFQAHLYQESNQTVENKNAHNSVDVGHSSVPVFPQQKL